MTEFKRTQRYYPFSCKIAAGLPPEYSLKSGFSRKIRKPDV